MTISATGLKAGFTLGTSDVADGADIRIDASGVTGDITIGDVDNASGDAEVIDIKAGGKALSVGSLDASDDVIVTVSAATTVGIGAIGGTVATSDVVLDLNGATGAITLAAIAGDNVTIKAGETIGAISYGGDITADGDVTITGSSIQANDLNTQNIVLNGTAQTVAFTGGANDDDLLIDAASTTTSVTVTGTFGVGTDTLDVDFETVPTIAANYTLDVTGASGYDTGTFTLSTEAYDATIKLATSDDADTIVMGVAEAVTITGFDKGEDDLDVQALATAGGVDVAANAAAVAIADGSAYVFADGADGTSTETIADYTDVADVAAFLDAAFSDEANADVIFAAINDLVSDTTYLYLATGQVANTFVGGITVLGTITEESGTALIASDFIS
jgi:hypothetical protein